MPRFLLVLGHQVRGHLSPNWPGAGRADFVAEVDGPWVAWRLLGSNHRELARSAAVFPDAGAARAAIETLHSGVDAAVATPESIAGRWSWQLSMGGVPVAVASRLYHRPHECAYSVAAAIAAARAAEVPSGAPRLPRVPLRPR